MKVDPRFLKEDGAEVFGGNELLVKGLLETEGGTHLWTGYPGSPVAGFFDCVESIKEIVLHHGIDAALANNEALSAAMVNGSQMSGLRGVAVMKSVGLHVAADALALGNLAGAHPEGGAVIICGDDPWNDSTQAPADSRFLFKHLFIPVLEPSTPQELKDWLDLAFKLSRESELFIGYLVTTNQADGGGSVTVRRNHYPHINTKNRFELDSSSVDLENKVLLPPRTGRREQDLPQRVARLWESAKKLGVNRTVWPKQRPASGKYPIGFVTSALAFSYLEHALDDLGVEDQIPILKLGLTYPLDPEVIREFAQKVETLIVVEERRPFLESEIALILSQHKLAIPLYGKHFPHGLEGFPSTNGLNPSIIIERVGNLLLKMPGAVSAPTQKIHKELDLISRVNSFNLNLVARTPTFCPGCPHRDSASVLNKIKAEFRDESYMRQRHRRGPVDLVFHGDTGCAVLLMFEPNQNLMHNYSGMGLAGGTGAGIDHFITNKQLVLLGDSTFFHSGQAAISNSIKNNQDITYIILDNKTTAMTGHQPTPGIETNLLGQHTFTQNIDAIIQAMVETQNVEVIRLNPEHREQYKTLLEETILKDGVKIVVADKECGITFHRREHHHEHEIIQDKGYLPLKRHINVTPDVCEYCLECTRATGCPGLTFVETDFGRKVQTDLSWCVADTACTRIHACPSFEEVTIIRTQKPHDRLQEIRAASLPDPRPLNFEHRWQTYLAGVGGMGVSASSAILAHAGFKEGYEVTFCDKVGLAIRNGGVYSQVTYCKKGWNHTSPLISYGKADLILGLDALEATRGLDPKGSKRIGSPEFTSSVINSAKTPTIATLTGKNDFSVEELEETLKRYTRKDSFFSADVSAYAERLFGTKLYVNVMMLGVAYQLGLLPLSIASLEYGVRTVMRKGSEDNWLAFKAGRKLVADLQSRPIIGQTQDYRVVLEEKAGYLAKDGPTGAALARRYRQIVADAATQLQVDERTLGLFAQRVYELIEYQDLALAQKYIRTVLNFHRRDRAGHGYAATAAFLWNLHRVMAIKDEVYVAWLLTRPEKYARDVERYNIHPELGDKIIYRHLNRPEFEIGAFKIRFKIRTRPWMLKIMRHMKFLRRMMPRWHSRERDFRDWYMALSEKFRAPENAAAYQTWVSILRVPEEATGYREVRYPRMDAARRKAERLLESLNGKTVSFSEKISSTV
jgi:indolepyruvate ferredoxin oxidoreductase